MYTRIKIPRIRGARTALPYLLAAVCLLIPAGPAHTASLEPAAPEQLRCPGRGGPRAVALDRSCNLYVADSALDRIVEYNPEEQPVAAFPLVAQDPGVEGPVHKLSPSGDAAGNDRVQRWIVVEVADSSAASCGVSGDLVGDANPIDIQQANCQPSRATPISTPAVTTDCPVPRSPYDVSYACAQAISAEAIRNWRE